jgi:hypothetical protein
VGHTANIRTIINIICREEDGIDPKCERCEETWENE